MYVVLKFLFVTKNTKKKLDNLNILFMTRVMETVYILAGLFFHLGYKLDRSKEKKN